MDGKQCKKKLCVGDIIRFTCRDSRDPIEGYVGEISIPGDCFYVWTNNTNLAGSKGVEDPRKAGYEFSWHVSFDDIKLDATIIKSSSHMELKEKFALAITPEPQKSFRKARITNGDNLLTDDGTKVFLSWLLEKNADAFKAEVVDAILSEQEGK